VADREIEQLIVDRVDTLCKGIENGADKRGQVTFIHFTSPGCFKTHNLQIIVTFSEKRPKKSWFQVYMGEEDVPWEQWYVILVND
jgi:hypothetical protein